MSKELDNNQDASMLIASIQRFYLRQRKKIEANEKATKAFIKLKEAAVLPLITAIADKQGRDRDKLVLILGELGDSRAIEPLIGTLNDPDKLTQIKAVEALGKLAEKFALPSKDGNWETNLRSLTYCLNFESNPISRVGQVMGFITDLKNPQEQREYLYAINCGLASSNKLTEQFELPLCSEEDLRRFLIILRIQTLKLICTKI